MSALTDSLLYANYRALRTLQGALDRNTEAVLRAADMEVSMAQEFDADVQALDAVVSQVVSVGQQLGTDVQALLDKLSSSAIDPAVKAELEADISALQAHASTLQGVDAAAAQAAAPAPAPAPAPEEPPV